MGFMNGRWVSTTVPNQLEYPFDIAAKLVRDIKSCNHEEVSVLVSTTRKFYDLCKEQDTTIRDLENRLRIAEHTIRLLQVDEDDWK